MSDSLVHQSPARPRFGIQPLRNWTLRSRLIAGLLALLVVVSLAIGTFTELALRSFLVDKLDQQLQSTGQRSQGFRGPDGDPTRLPLDRHILLPPGSPTGTVSIAVSGAVITDAGRISPDGYQVGVEDEVAAKLTTITSTNPVTISLPGLGDYRALTRIAADGDRVVLAFPMSGVNNTLIRLTIVITALTIAGLIIAGLLGAAIVRLALRPLRRVTDTAARVAEMQLDEGEVALAVRVPEPNPHTEVGQVGVALNHMLENVSDALNARHQSEMRVRQFVADASHELRTPLASIRGYAELTRRTLPSAPEDVRHAMSRVESEAARMTTLVEDLLLLARLDAGRPLESDDVDLTRLLLDAVGDAHAASPQHTWKLELPDDPIMVPGDGPRLHQVVTNLLANARTHTPVGTNVTASLTVQGPWARIDVTDDGPGIPADRLDEIFVRFSRGEESRSRANGSTGLGLAIAQAVAQAHGGRIEVASQPGRTVFTVWLPTHRNPQGMTQESARVGQQSLQV